MSMIVIVGAQWGDEGKGKIVDLLAEQADVVARYGGGANAGHTSYVDGTKYVMHLLPSGLLRGKKCVLGNMVIEPEQLLEEMTDFVGKGVDVSPEQILISSSAQIVLPTHKALDAAYENARGKNALGTTKRGIGPAYADKALRRGLRAGMMLYPSAFGGLVCELAQAHNRELAMLGYGELDPDEIAGTYEGYARRLADYVQDTSLFLHRCLEAGQTVLAEGAQGTLLDVDHGCYPFVTSSSTVAGAAAPGLGVSPKFFGRIIGVTKCFQTRVGEGPMPTEILGNESLSNHLRGDKNQPGAEYGATTGRPRRVGWLDLPLLRYAIRVNGLSELVFTKLDVLSGLESVKICVAYSRNGKTYRELSENAINCLHEFSPEYEHIVGWSENIGQTRNSKDLSVCADFYVRRVENLVGVPVTLVSVGTDRDQIIHLK